MALASGRMVVYTCVTAGYDEVEPVPRIGNLDFVLITDSPPAGAEGWIIRSLQPG